MSATRKAREPRTIPLPSKTSGLKPRVGSLTGGSTRVTADVELVRVPLNDIGYDLENMRDVDVDDLASRPSTLELAEDLKVLGQLEPAVLVPRDVYLKRWPEHEDKVKTPFVVMSGNRRRCAAELIGWEDLECILRRQFNEDLDLLIDRAYAFNVQREGVNPLREAHHLAGLMKRFGNSQRKVASHIHKSQPYVQQRLSLLKLLPELQEQVAAETLGAKAGRLLASLPKADQKVVLDKAQRVEPDARSDWWPRAAEAAVAARQQQAKRQAQQEQDHSGDNPVITPQAKPGTSANPSERPSKILLGSPEDIADQLRRYLTSEEFAVLVDLLMEHAEH